jgi:hypothetical protein
MRPILFSTPMVQAILDGRKTQTRRVIKRQPPISVTDIINIAINWIAAYPNRKAIRPFIYSTKCPYGQVGDVLWVRETWQKIEGDRFIYKADPIIWGGKWKPSIFMPKEACRILLKVVSIKVERLQDISTNDALAEGVDMDKSPCIEPINAYGMLWNQINGKDSWSKNPWLWVIEFKKISS